MIFDAATEAYLARLLDQAPPLDAEQAALVVRTFATKTTGATTAREAA